MSTSMAGSTGVTSLTWSGAEHHDAGIGGGAADVLADPERMRPDQQHRIGQIEVGRDPLPLRRSRHRRVGFAVPPGGRVQQHAASGELVQRQHRRQRFAGRREALVRGPATQHVVARIPGDHHAIGGQSERAAQPGRRDRRGGRHQRNRRGRVRRTSGAASRATPSSRTGCRCAAWRGSPNGSVSAGSRATAARRTRRAPRTG